MVVLMVGIVIVILVMIAIINKGKHAEINKDIQNHNCMPQPVILKNGENILVQIDMSYHIIDSKKAKNAIENGINIFRKLEYEGITELRRIADEIDNLEDSIIKLEDDVKNKLSEIGQDLGAEIIELHIKFGERKDFNIGNNIYNTFI